MRFGPFGVAAIREMDESRSDRDQSHDESRDRRQCLDESVDWGGEDENSDHMNSGDAEVERHEEHSEGRESECDSREHKEHDVDQGYKDRDSNDEYTSDAHEEYKTEDELDNESSNPDRPSRVQPTDRWDRRSDTFACEGVTDDKDTVSSADGEEDLDTEKGTESFSIVGNKHMTSSETHMQILKDS